MLATETRQASGGDGQVWPLSRQAYRTLGEMGLIPSHTELLYGQVYFKMSKSPFHSLLVMRLLAKLNASLPAGLHVRPEQPLACDDSEPEPDLAVARGSFSDYRQDHPATAELVIEICVTSHQYDRAKLQAYARAGVKEVWFVLGPEKQVEVYSQPEGGFYASHRMSGPGGELGSSAVPGVVVSLEELFQA